MFTSSMTSHSSAIVGNGTFEYDAPNQRMNLTFAVPWFGNILNISTVLLNNSGVEITNGRCDELNGSHFGDIFSWLAFAKFAGETTLGPEFEGRTCNLWNFTSPASNLSMCFDNDNTRPVLWSVFAEGLSDFYYFWTDFNPVQPDPSHFTPPKSCSEKLPLCANGTVAEIDAYVFHPENQFDLINEDVADELGDVLFICYDGNNTGFDKFAWVSHYTLQVWSGWGEYSICNRPKPNMTGVCIGKETFSVGREGPGGIGQNCGQCTDNSLIGSWYSLPKDGLCNSSSQPLGPDQSKGDCSWRVLERVKTIDGECLLKTQGMLAACAKQYAYPFTPSRAVFRQAFASDDTKQGGCPPIAPPATAASAS